MHFLVLCLSLLAISDTNAQKNYTLQEFLKAPDEELIQHKQELDRLIAQNKLNIPQSQAMLFYPDPIQNRINLKDQLLKWYPESKSGWFTNWYRKVVPRQASIPISANKALDAAMKVEEKAKAENDLVLYHSTQPAAYAKNYINTQLQKLALELEGKDIDTQTLLMRDPNKPRSYEEEKAIRKRFLKSGGYDPHLEEAEYLVSSNLGLTGSTTDYFNLMVPVPGVRFPSESTLDYFLRQRNQHKDINIPIFTAKDNKLLDEIIKSENDELIKLSKEFNANTNTGILLQLILKDDQLARKVLYNAQPGGWKSYITRLYGEKIDDPVTILRTMQTDPTAFQTKEGFYGESLNTQQMRVILSGDQLLDLKNPKPVKNFEVKAYSASDQNLKEFQQKVDAAVQKIRSDYLAQKQQMSWPKRIQYGTRDLFYKRQSPWEQREQYKRMLQGDISSPFE